jgi:preprotein translocase subunit SecF
MNIIAHRRWYYTLSLLVIIPGLVALLLGGLKPSIDFTGGTRITYAGDILGSTIQDVYEDAGVAVVSLQRGTDSVIVRTKPLTVDEYHTVASQAALRQIQEVSMETVGPTIGAETAINALQALGLASLLIVLYIAWAFRTVPKPANSVRFGICAVIAMMHDALVLIGAFAMFGYFFGVEVDSLFVTAVLTVIGFSVHDTIVVFDRVREHLQKIQILPFAQVVNNAILQTMARSLNTSVTVILVLVALLLFGGESIRWFVAALLIGVVSGTYSSIFNAAPLLVTWQEWKKKSK